MAPGMENCRRRLLRPPRTEARRRAELSRRSGRAELVAREAADRGDRQAPLLQVNAATDAALAGTDGYRRHRSRAVSAPRASSSSSARSIHPWRSRADADRAGVETSAR